jgi:AcrR family transcriptional regulator
MMATMSTRRGRKKTPGRPAGAAPGRSREAILRAARHLFAKAGFGGTTMRAVAARAKVDVALVHYFFESKAGLFAAAVEMPAGAERLPEVLRSGEGPRGERVVRFYLQEVLAPGNLAVAALLRAALADPGCVPALRRMLEEGVVAAAASVLTGPDARLRAELLGAQIVGIFVVRSLVGVQPLASTSTEELARRLGPAVDAILAGP